MSRRVLAVVFAAAFGGFLIAGLPLGIVARTLAAGSALTFDYASGTVWNGALHDARIGGRHFGDLHLTLNPLHLVLARMRLGFSFDGVHGSGSGALEFGIGSYRALKDATMEVTVENFALGMVLAGKVSLDAVTLVVEGGNCRRAGGGLSTDIPARNAAVLGWQGPVIAGAIECRDGALHLPLSGARGTETVNVETLLFADRRYEARVVVTTEDQRLAQVLSAVGFSNQAGVLGFEQAGRWTDHQFDMPSAGG